MKKIIFMILTVILSVVSLIISTTNSQEKKVHKMVFDAGEVTIIQGLMAIIKVEDNSLVVEMIPPKDQLPKKYKDVDLKKGDIIKMCNGKSVKNTEDLNNILDPLEIGDEISFGVKRGRDMMIVSFPKADPNAGGKMMVMTQTIDDGGGDVNTNMIIDGESLDNVILLDFGLVINESENGITVLKTLPMLKENVEGQLPEKGDIIISLNGEKYTSAEKLEKKFSSIAEGDNVEMTFLRDGKEFTVSFAKKGMGGSEVIITK